MSSVSNSKKNTLYQKRLNSSHFVVIITRVKTDEKPKLEESFTGNEDTRLRFDIYFVKKQVLSSSNTVLGVEFIEYDEACYS